MPRNVPTSAAPTLCPISDGRTVDRSHRDDDAEHRSDDAQAGQRVGDLAEGCRGPRLLVMPDVEVLVHERFEVVGADAADDDHLDGISQKVDGVMAREELRILRHDVAVRGRLEVWLERHDARLLRHLEQLIQHRQEIVVVVLARAGAEERLHLSEQLLDHRWRRADEQAAERRAADDDELRRLIQDERFSAFHQVAAGHRSQHHQRADNYQHDVLNRLPRISALPMTRAVHECVTVGTGVSNRSRQRSHTLTTSGSKSVPAPRTSSAFAAWMEPGSDNGPALSVSKASAMAITRAPIGMSLPLRPNGCPLPSKRSRVAMRMSAVGARNGMRDTMSAAIRTCDRIKACSPAPSGQVLRMISFGITSFPTSCKSAARSMCPRSGSSMRMLRGHQDRRRCHAPRVLECGDVLPIQFRQILVECD